MTKEYKFSTDIGLCKTSIDALLDSFRSQFSHEADMVFLAPNLYHSYIRKLVEEYYKSTDITFHIEEDLEYNRAFVCGGKDSLYTTLDD